ncbi:uncharacterized protein LOC131850830 [Achroia grisella]|uniref:uncharacterized protein LOC131850830 n=1 Tax=Achroia grisella TaxID=688607 RepID=UPI0027D33D09|nr:uncharacterized protein LOC131850830 [Achroia grisella]
MGGGYLWGISQLVNNPSTPIIHAIQNRLTRKEEETCTTSTCQDKQQLQVVVASNKSYDSRRNNGSKITVKCSNKVSAVFEGQPQSIQVGSGLTKHRNVAVQCNKTFCKKTSRTTSIQQILCSDNSTTTRWNIDRRNIQTNTSTNKICNEHHKVFTLLTDRAIIDRFNVKDKPTLIIRLKSKLHEMLKLIQMNKIENLTKYHPPQENVLRLYKSISFENVNISKR